MKNRILLASVFLLLLLSLVLASCGPAAAPTPTGPAPTSTQTKTGPTLLRWGVAFAASAAFPITVSEAKLINQTYPGEIQISVTETGGYLENLDRLANRTIEIGLGDLAPTYAAYSGTMDYSVKKPQSDLRSLGTIVVSPIIVFARADSGIKKIEDFQGKKFAITAGSATGRLDEMWMDALGITVTWDRRGGAAKFDAVKSGAADITETIGWRASAVVSLQATTDLIFIDITQEHMEKIWKKYPGQGGPPIKIPANTYTKQDYDFWAGSFVLGDYVRADIPDDVVYKVIKTVYENRQAIAEPIDMLRQGGFVDMWQQTLDAQNVPLHPGAVKFFREKGFQIPDKLLPK